MWPDIRRQQITTEAGNLSGFVQSWSDNAIIWKSGNQNQGMRFGSASDLAAGSWSEKLRITDARQFWIRDAAFPAFKIDIFSPDNDGATRLRLANTASLGLNAPGSFPTIEVLGARGDGNGTFEGRLALGTRRTDGNALSNQTLGAVLFGGQYGTSTTFASNQILYPASIQGVAEGTFSAAATMPTGIAFFTGSTGNDVASGNLSYGTERLRITNAGNVLIGQQTQVNSTYKLDVAGNVRANRIVVNTTGADFVFDSDYAVPSLKAVEEYIKRHHHLPGIDGAETEKKNGLDLGSQQTKLLQKIEELTLYIIGQDKDLQELKKENEGLKALQERMERLEKRMNEQK